MQKTEVEVKLKIDDAERASARLVGLGARLTRPREFEENQIYDFPDFSLKTRGAMLRVRTSGDAATLTYKDGARVEAGAKVRDEMEVSVSSGETMSAIVGKLGMRPLFRYQKYRTIYSYAELVITVDETPMGEFLELEGPKPLIDEVASKLGFRTSEYISKSYLTLYQDYLKAKGLPLKDMIFGAA